jgi:hypothetical protein
MAEQQQAQQDQSWSWDEPKPSAAPAPAKVSPETAPAATAKGDAWSWEDNDASKPGTAVTEPPFNAGAAAIIPPKPPSAETQAAMRKPTTATESVLSTTFGPHTFLGNALGVSNLFSENAAQFVHQNSPLEAMMQKIHPGFKGGLPPMTLGDAAELGKQVQGGSELDAARQVWSATGEPIGNASQQIDKTQHPFLKAAAEQAESMISPRMVAVMEATGGLSSLFKTVTSRLLVSKLISAGFGVNSIVPFYQHSKEFADAVEKHDYPEAVYQLTHAMGTGLLGSLMLKSAAEGAAPVKEGMKENVQAAKQAVGATPEAAAAREQATVTKARDAQFESFRKAAPSTRGTSYEREDFDRATPEIQKRLAEMHAAGEDATSVKGFIEGANRTVTELSQEASRGIPRDAVAPYFNPLDDIREQLDENPKTDFAEKGMKVLDEFKTIQKIKAGKEVTLGELDDLRSDLNKLNDQAMSKIQSYDRTKMRVDSPEFAAQELLNNAIKDYVYNDPRVPDAVRNLRRTVDSSIKLREAAERQSESGDKKVSGTGKPSLTKKIVSGLVGAGTAAAVETAASPLLTPAGALVPAGAAGGAAALGTNKFLGGEPMTRDQLIESMKLHEKPSPKAPAPPTGGANPKVKVGPAAVSNPWHEQAASAVRSGDGFSFHPETGEAPKDGYMVEFSPEHQRIHGAAVTAEDIKKFSDDNAAVLGMHPDLYVGGYKNELNVSAKVPDLEAAKRLAGKLDQEAIYDVKNKKLIETGGTNTQKQFPEYSLHQRLVDAGLREPTSFIPPAGTENYHPELQRVIAQTKSLVDDASRIKDQAAFITPDGRFSYLRGGEQHWGVIGKPTPERPDPRIDFLNQTGAIRTRFGTGRAGDTLHISVPKTGVTEEQVTAIRQAVGRLGRNANLVLETADNPAQVKSTTREFVKQSDIEPMLREIGAHPDDRINLGPAEARLSDADTAMLRKHYLDNPEASEENKSWARQQLIQGQRFVEHTEMPPEKIPAGDTAEGIRIHELVHHVMGDKVGFPAEYVGSYLHPKANASTAAFVSFDLSSIGDREPDGSWGIDVSKVRDNIDRFVIAYLSGGVGDEVYNGIPMSRNRGLSGDRAQLQNVLSAAGFTSEQALEVLKAADRAIREHLQNPEVERIIREAAKTREEGLPETHLYSGERLKEISRQIREATNEDKGAGNQRGVVGGASGGNQENVTGREGAGAGNVAAQARAEVSLPEDQRLELRNKQNKAALRNAAREDLYRRQRRFEAAQPKPVNVPPETTTGIYDDAIKAAGAVPGGITKGDDVEPDYVNFADPRTGSTLGLPVDQVSPEAIRAELQKSRVKFGVAPTQQEDVPFGQDLTAEEPRISTRVPTAKKATENALEGAPLTIGAEQVHDNPDVAQKFADRFNDYTGGGKIPGNIKDPSKILNRHISRLADNLKWLWNQVDPAQRERTRQWYTSANRMAGDMAEKNNISVPQAAAVIASQSPQTEWFTNASRAERITDTMRDKQDFVGTQDMMETAARILKTPVEELQAPPEEGDEEKGPLLADLLADIDGKKLSELKTPIEKAAWIRLYDETYNDRSYHEIDPATGDKRRIVTKKGGVPAKASWGSLQMIANAVSVLEDGSRKNISEKMGQAHKVRNFYNNIVDPSNPDDVTIDTHAVAAAHVRPLAGKDTEVKDNFGGGGKHAQTGIYGTYPIYAEAYRSAARDLGVLPRELQSVVWEHIREMFTDTFKSDPANKEAIDKMWQKHDNGTASIEDTRQAVKDYAQSKRSSSQQMLDFLLSRGVK